MKKWIFLALILTTPSVFANVVKPQTVRPEQVQVYTFDGFSYNNGLTVIINGEKHFLSSEGIDINGSGYRGFPLVYWESIKLTIDSILGEASSHGNKVTVDLNAWNTQVAQIEINSQGNYSTENAQGYANDGAAIARILFSESE